MGHANASIGENKKISTTNFEGCMLSSTIKRSSFLKKYLKEQDCLSLGLLATLEAISDHYNPKNKCVWASQSTIAEITCQHEKSITRHVSTLKRAGLLLIEKRKGTNKNKYWFTKKLFELLDIEHEEKNLQKTKVTSCDDKGNIMLPSNRINKGINKNKDFKNSFKKNPQNFSNFQHEGKKTPTAEATRELLNEYAQNKNRERTPAEIRADLISRAKADHQAMEASKGRFAYVLRVKRDDKLKELGISLEELLKLE